MATESTRVAVRERRSFSDADKRRLVAEYRAAVASGEGGGVVLRREGIFQSLVHRWGRKIDDGTLGARRASPAPAGRDPAKVRVRELEEQLARARATIGTLEELVTAQGKCLALHVDVRHGDSATFPTTS
jgi:transposase-like protein